MAVRNYWIETEIDGRKSTLRGGPASKTGGFSQKISIRRNGAISTAVQINGHVLPNGQLLITIEENGVVVHTVKGVR